MLKLEVIGNIGKDAEVKRIGNSDYICFPVAHSERKKGQESDTVWVNCCKYFSDAGKLREFLTKGTRVFVRGNMTVKEFRTGGVCINLFVDEVELIGSQPTRGGREEAPEYDDLP